MTEERSHHNLSSSFMLMFKLDLKLIFVSIKVGIMSGNRKTVSHRHYFVRVFLEPQWYLCNLI